MKRFGVFLCVMLLLMISGCSQEDALMIEDEGPVWVITEQESYDDKGNRNSRVTYEYDGDANHYRQNSYNGADELVAYMVVTKSNDGTEEVHTSYLPDDTVLMVQTKTFRSGDKTLSDKAVSPEGEYIHNQTWQWNETGKKADIYFSSDYDDHLNNEPRKIGTVEYDDQNRKIREVMNDVETTYIYEDQKITMWTDFNARNRYAIVRYYDEQDRLVEVYDYRVNHDGNYTDDDLVIYTKQTYKEDGHSMTVEYWTKDEATGDALTGITEITYQLLEDVV